MPDKPKNLASDLRGTKSLAVTAVTGISEIVQSMHLAVSSFAGLRKTPGKQLGITGQVYRSINSITGLVGLGLDKLLVQIGTIVGDKKTSSVTREAIVSIINGVLGDHLLATDNPLQIAMQFRLNGIVQTPAEIKSAVKIANGKVLILVHGSCMNDLQWQRNGCDHGRILADEFGYAHLYLHYNSGRHISDNGQQLADLLETLYKLTGASLELNIIAHSMGGLVSRSAIYQAQESGYKWPQHLQKIIFLGSPHHGAPLEKTGNLLDHILEINRYSAPFTNLLKIRSAGITDLRYGNLVATDWRDQNRFKLQSDRRKPIPLPENVDCYTIAASKAEKSKAPIDNLVGDGLVTVPSALGKHKNPLFQLKFPPDHQWIGRQMNHWDLLDHPEISVKIKTWMPEKLQNSLM